MPRRFQPATRAGFTLLLSLLAAPLAAQPCGTPGRDGSGTITGVVNTYYPGTASTTASSTSISVGAPSGASARIAAGDLLLVIQMQDAALNSTDSGAYGDGTAGDPATGATNLNSSGLYEYVVATGPVSGGAVPVLGGGNGGLLLNVYTNANATATQGQRRFQVIRVPQYSSATLSSGLTALAWNGSVGGVLAIDVSGALALGGATVSVDALGFRGGGGRSLAGSTTGFNANAYRTLATQSWHASKAEGIAGTPRFVYDGTNLVDNGAANEGYPNGSYGRGAPGNAGGGGNDFANDNSNNSGGGGGGNGGAGGHGGNTWSSNQPLGGFGGAAFAGTASRLALGGGGGAGTSNNAGPGHGGPGGGILLFRLDTVSGTGTLSTDGSTPPDSSQDGAGGGGAGGSVFVGACTSPNLTGLTVRAHGARGGNVNWTAGDFHGPGGGGGGGIVELSGTATSIDVTGGANGTSPTATAYNAVSGSAGTSATNASVSTGLGARPGCICRVTQVLVTAFQALPDPSGPGAVVEWRTASEVGTAGFDLFRLGASGWVQVNERLLPAARPAPQGASYRQVDPGAAPGGRYTYFLREVETAGGVSRTRFHGPFTVALDGRRAETAPAAGYERQVRRPAPAPAMPAAPAAAAARAARTIVNTPAQKAKLYVRERGVYQLPASQIGTLLGVPASTAAQWIRGSLLELYRQGTRVAWEGEPDGSALRFYGEPPAGIYAAESVYWLSAGKKSLSLSPVDGGRPFPATPSQSFLDTTHFEQQSFPGVAIAADPEADYWYWAVLIAGDPGYGSQSFPLAVHGLAAAAPPPSGAELTIHLQGASAAGVHGEHAFSLLVNGIPVGDGAFDGLSRGDFTFPLSPSLLHEGDNTVEVQALSAPGVPWNILYVDSFDLRYPRLYQTGGAPLFFRGGGNKTVTVTGFGSSGVEVWDVTDPGQPSRLTGAPVTPAFTPGRFQVSFAPGKSDRLYLAFDSAGFLTPRAEGWTPPAVSLRSPGGADHLILAPAALLEPAQALARYRRSQGLASQVVSLEQIYDEWNDGLPDPHAVARFLASVMATWNPAPRTVVLAGAGSYDYKNYLGLGGNLFPPLLLASGNGLFAADSQYLPPGSSAVVGRIPAWSAAELQGYVDKLIAYEGSSPGDWRRQVLLVADNPDEGGQFDVESDRLAADVPAPFAPARLYLSQQSPAAAAALRAQLGAALANGAFLLDYVGHAGLDRLSSQSILTNDDARALANAPRLPVFMAMACLVGRFEVPGFRSLAEELTDNPGGGAAAVWAPAGVGYDAQAAALGRALSQELFLGRAATLGEAVSGAANRFRAAGGLASTLSSYNLFGDPALHLARPQ